MSQAAAAHRKAVRLWGSRATTIWPGRIVDYPPPVYQVGRSYLRPDGELRFVEYGRGRSWAAAFRMAAKRSSPCAV